MDIIALISELVSGLLNAEASLKSDTLEIGST